MRIRTLLATAAVGTLATAAGAGIAAAADLPNYVPPPAAAYTPAPAYSWTGPYAGLVGGYAWGTTPGWEGGGFLGYNLQTNQNLVVGLEGDVTFANRDGLSNGLAVHNNWNGTLRGRIGYAMDRFMVYGTGGLAVGGLSSSSTSESATKVGWTAGAGIEAALTDKVTGRVEYRHTDLGAFPTGGSNVVSDAVMVGVGFKF
ncbi:MAG TPA: outer membrane beta-barrel protein [Bauldia sp.]|nr:outer membrane beta-barrel protein [Bauldia sp.]